MYYDEKRILAIARKAVQSKGYVVYADFNEYIRQLICNKGKPKPTQVSRSLFELRVILCQTR